MEEKVERYLRDEKGVNSEVARERLWKKVAKYDDILREFENWLEVREYAPGVTIEGYSAQRIYGLAPRLDGIGVFNFLVDLRDNPDEAKQTIADGFRVR